MVYQPQVDNNDQCKYAEALIRWHHAEQGMILPNVFIAIAEQSGLSIILGEWVVNEACRQLNQWNLGGYQLERLSINVSQKQFLHKDFVKTIKKALKIHNVKGQQLCIEITEHIIIENIEETLDIIAVLNKMSITISIDDFGTGYSSLTQLKQLPLGQLKIDRKLINTGLCGL